MLSPTVQSFLDGLKTDPELSVWQWSDLYRVLTTESAAEAGPWRTSRLPYAYKVMEALSVTDPCREVIVMKGAQLGFTEIGNCWLGYIMDWVPGPVLCVQPDLITAKRFSIQRIDTLISSSPALKNKVDEKKSRDSGNTIFSKSFPGGMMVIGGSNSAAGLRSMPIRYLFLDEIDGYTKDVENEGSPIKLAEARTATFENKKKIYKISTPVLEGQSEIVNQFNKSSKERYYVPCPHCETRQLLVWESMRYDPDKIRDTVHYECQECRGKIYEYHKTQMLEAGEWIADNPEETYIRGFHINSLYSPVGFKSWASCAIEYEEARGDDKKMKSFTNTTLGLPFKDAGETPDYQRLYERREDYRAGWLPLGATILTAGIDVQKDRLECAVVAYSARREKWLIEYKICQGDIEQSPVWDEMHAYLEQDWPVEGSDITVKISAFAIDSGFANLHVSQFAKRFYRNRCFMIKGSTSIATFIGNPRQGEVKVSGKKVKTGLRIWNVNVDMAKDELFRQLLLPMSDDGKPQLPGFFHFHRDLSKEWFQGLCSEELRQHMVKGFPVFHYEKIFKRNEPLDCVNYCRAAFAIIGGDRYKESKWKQLEQDLGREESIARAQAMEVDERIMQMAVTPMLEEPTDAPATVIAQAKPAAPVKKRRSSYWD